MIKANELRIGNWYIDAFAGKTQVRGIDLDDWEAINSTPIVLTPEILQQCGFEKIEETGHWWLSVFEGYVHIGFMFEKFPLVLDIDDCRMPLHHIKYLHQLQNLFFSLTGEELTVNHKVLSPLH